MGYIRGGKGGQGGLAERATRKSVGRVCLAYTVESLPSRHDF
jgi:hypothetical protein